MQFLSCVLLLLRLLAAADRVVHRFIFTAYFIAMGAPHGFAVVMISLLRPFPRRVPSTSAREPPSFAPFLASMMLVRTFYSVTYMLTFITARFRVLTVWMFHFPFFRLIPFTFGARGIRGGLANFERRNAIEGLLIDVSLVVILPFLAQVVLFGFSRIWFVGTQWQEVVGRRGGA